MMSDVTMTNALGRLRLNTSTDSFLCKCFLDQCYLEFKKMCNIYLNESKPISACALFEISYRYLNHWLIISSSVLKFSLFSASCILDPKFDPPRIKVSSWIRRAIREGFRCRGHEPCMRTTNILNLEIKFSKTQ